MPKSALMDEAINDARLSGILFGLAAGDHIGGPTAIALELAESLCNHGAFNLHEIRYRYLSWWLVGGFDTGPVAERASSIWWRQALSGKKPQLERIGSVAE